MQPTKNDGAADMARHLRPLLTVDLAATPLSMARQTLNNWRSRGYGPPYLKIGRRVFYDVADLHAWRDAQRRLPMRSEADQ
ncbi:MAG: DNA-binding protein [Alphaproteobacteria bacterium]|nr:MAG: DNA-binding protein [Alphaproteobacteria bacterium]